jgi:hypothetical protein
VTLNGVVVTSPRFDAFTPDNDGSTALDGYFVADQAGGAFSGLFVVIDRAEATEYLPGDVLNLSGDLEERYCFTQLYVTSHEVTGTAAQPDPTEVTAETLSDETHESGIVTLKNIEVTGNTDWGGFVLAGGVEVAFGFASYFLNLNVGGTYDITGAVKYSYNTFQLIPRSDADVVHLGGGGTEATIEGLQGGDASTNCTDADNNLITASVTLEGVVAQERFSMTSNYDAYYLTNGGTEPNSGIVMVISKNAATNFALGSRLAVVGDYKEFYCLSEVFAQNAQVIAEGEAVPAAVEVGSPADLLAVAEGYEGMLVTVTGVEVTNAEDWENFGYVSVNGTELLIEGKILYSDDFPPAEVGATWTSVTGFLSYGFDQYRLQPRSLDDFATQDAAN